MAISKVFGRLINVNVPGLYGVRFTPEQKVRMKLTNLLWQLKVLRT